ncbi:MAG: SpoIIIAH-like family protein [Clostridia bacterium]|nr:SpoIIIAH-like family protein [Clostridia bacterium]
MTKVKLFGKTGALAKFGRRNWIIVSAVLLIGVAVYLNYLWFYDPVSNIGYGDNNMDDNYTSGNNAPSDDKVSTEDSYFTSAALSRQNARDEALEVLQSVVTSEDAEDTAKSDALEEISKIALAIQNEANIEALVSAKGFEDCIAVISGDSVSVIVKQADPLVASQVAQIYEIVYNETGILPANVNVIQK